MLNNNTLFDFQLTLEQLGASRQAKNLLVIGVCGFAGAGKTTLCRALSQAWPHRFLWLECDLLSALSYWDRTARIEQARASGDPACLEAEENPVNWYDWYGIKTAIQGLRQRGQFETHRAWNQKSGELDAFYAVQRRADDCPVTILCDCIFLLHAPVRHWLDATVLIESAQKSQKSRRALRAKNADAELAAMQRYERFELPYFQRHRCNADVVFQTEA